MGKNGRTQEALRSVSKPFRERRYRLGAIDVPFNWIFIMVAGGAILLAVFAFVAKQQKAFKEDIASTVLRDLRAITAGGITAKGTSQKIDIPDSDITFDCTEECDCGMTIGNVRSGFKDNIIFAPKKISGTQLILWAQDWSLPIRVTNFLFMTTPRVKFYLVPYGSTSKTVFKALKERIPENLDVTALSDTTAASLVDYIGEDAVRFIIVDESSNHGGPITINCQQGFNLKSSFKEADVSCVTVRAFKANVSNAYDIEIKTRDPNTNTLTFQSKQFRVIGEAPVIAAAFSEDAHQWECNMKRAYRRLASVSNLMVQRSDYLQKMNNPGGGAGTLCREPYPCIIKQPTQTSWCPDPGTLKKYPPEKFMDAARSISARPELKNSFSYSTGNDQDKDIELLQSNLKLIITANNNFLRQDCPLIY